MARGERCGDDGGRIAHIETLIAAERVKQILILVDDPSYADEIALILEEKNWPDLRVHGFVPHPRHEAALAPAAEVAQ